MRLDEEVEFGRETIGVPENDPPDRFPTGRTKAAETLLGAPFSVRCLRVGADHGAVDHVQGVRRSPLLFRAFMVFSHSPTNVQHLN